MKRTLWGCGLIFAAFVFMTVAFSVRAQDHQRWHQYYRTWTIPGTTVSCCNARIIGPSGHEVGDCEPTRYEIRNGDWYAWLRQKNTWIIIPDAKIIRERNPSGEEGHLCWTEWSGILCAVPPDTGG